MTLFHVNSNFFYLILPFARYSHSKYTWPWPLDWRKSNVNMRYVKRYMLFPVLAIAMFALSITISEIFTYELPLYSIQIFNLENEGKWFWWFRWTLAGELALSIWIWGKIGASRFGRLFQFSRRPGLQMDGCLPVLPNSITLFVCWNFLKRMPVNKQYMLL